MADRHEEYASPTQLERMFPNSHRREEIRMMAKRAKEPIPSIRRGVKRKTIGIRPSVYASFLDYEEGLISYDEVVERARRSSVGVRQ